MVSRSLSVALAPVGVVRGVYAAVAPDWSRLRQVCRDCARLATTAPDWLKEWCKMTFAMFDISNSSNGAVVAEHDIVSEKDLEHLLHLLDDKVGDAAWQNQMERTTPNMIYQAWRHEPEVRPTLLTNPSISLTNLIMSI
ncbi:hypothetical protein GW17_00014077 [Ensete ventricosum]|nr:hypothetical protein GW17_00014077 [Ensete ventricosum]